MHIISIDYIILIIVALFVHQNTMLVLTSYALPSIWIINYAQECPVNFVKHPALAIKAINNMLSNKILTDF